ncbi:DedA family protein [Luteipulveratus flavus]|uniref:DedA family protein n=1 Tax=Luteipulveratus flavus TaxID=3031728 RepID=A0ABT6CAN6_9MICO|nr:DedA family protein [Luteipulveratus sp. YIM 133296]MDF8265943.1 DedA family protein [Luteipulveratus sp. YIM 133296]
MLDTVNTFILDLAGQPWVYAAVGALGALDAFIPPLPSESAIVALAALGHAGGVNLWLLAVVGALGALIGDTAAYVIGRRVGTDRFAWQRGPKITSAIDRAGRELDRRGGMLIFTARYIPVGRIAVMLAAGATGMRARRFLAYATIGCAAWSGWSVVVGAVAGHLLGDNPLLAAAVGIAIALTIGLGADRVASRYRGQPAPESGRRERERVDA